jgi:probable HAF family extracellular repeat protein
MVWLTYADITANTDPNGATYTTAINAAGQVIGTFTGAGGVNQFGYIAEGSTVTAIAVSGALVTAATAINGAGVVVGTYADANGTVGGFIDTAGSIAVLAGPAGVETLPDGIDAAGQVGGTLVDEATGASHGFVETAGQFTTIDVPGATATDISAMNATGEVVGQYLTSSGATFCFVDTGGAIATFAIAGASFMNPAAINAAGEVVGSYTGGDGHSHGFVYDAGSLTTLDVPGQASTILTGVNDSGEIVGNSSAGAFLDLAGAISPVAWPGAAMPATVTAVNDSGVIAGNYDAPVAGGGDAFAPRGFLAAPCYGAGTRIATVLGDVAVEALRPGARVVSAFGGSVAVVWVGRRHVACHRHPAPRSVWPVRVHAGAFAPQVPARDLLLSPDHCVYVEGVLIPVRSLINGVTVTREPVDEVVYFHVELPAHDVIFAEGLPAESYLDTGNRRDFDNGGTAGAPAAETAEGLWRSRACADHVTRGPCHAAAVARLTVRARIRQGLGWADERRA